MTSTSITTPTSGTSTMAGLPADPRGGSRLRRLTEWGPAAIGLVAGALVVVGVLLPWVSTFAGLVSMSGSGTRNGGILLAMGALTMLASAFLALRRDVRARWAIGILGFAAAVFAGYLLINLYAALRAADSMALPSAGPGLWVAVGGGALALATMLLPATSTSAPAHEGASPRTGRTVLRYATALFAIVAAVAHIPVTPEHLREAAYIGVGFMLLTAALLILAAALLTSDSRLVWLLTLAVSAAAVAAYVVSRTIGLPLIGDDVGNWLEPLGVVSVVTETATAVLAWVALRSGPLLPGNEVSGPSA